MRTLLLTVSFLGLVLAAAWHLGALAPLMPALRSATSAVLGAPAVGGARVDTPAGPGGLRKCVAGERVLYTDSTCPPGYATAPVQGHVNVVAPVVPASVPAAKPAPGTAAEGTLRDQMIDRVVNR
ncbi:hypothetical protein KAK06_18435 [Ideonella sp. 4Y11]|uniref:DUF4124 domain-containing protein n=1 Tax=Ideonella aquatica TaxID=2824119 RepID=A0A940YXD4_9BURK|nr:hypothetical protein [Ideonella aquatica]MBQ0960940.1 hypothetical protein [Ideonella aquatica]